MISSFQTERSGRCRPRSDCSFRSGQSVWSGYTLFVSTFWMQYSILKSPCSNFRVITVTFWCPNCHEFYGIYLSKDSCLLPLWFLALLWFFVPSCDLRSSMVDFKTCNVWFFLDISVSTLLIQASHFSIESSTVSGSMCLFVWKSDFWKYYKSIISLIWRSSAFACSSVCDYFLRNLECCQ